MTERQRGLLITFVLALAVIAILAIAVRAQQPSTPSAPVAGIALTPAERAEIESMQKDLQLADAQFQLLQYKLKELQSSYQQTAAAMSQRVEVARRDHKLDAGYTFDQAGMQFVKKPTSAAPPPPVPKNSSR